MISTVEKVLFLKSIDLFSQIPSEELSQIAQIADEVDFDNGEHFIVEGDLGEELFLIIEGTVKVHKGDFFIVELGEKECVGDMAVLDSAPRMADVTASSDVRALRIKRDDFTEIMSEKVTIAQGIIKVLLRRLRDVQKK